MDCRRPGFTLIEIMIAVFIFSLVLGGFVLGIRSARTEVEFSDKHITVLACSQKVVEDLKEEIWMNPYGFRTLGVEASAEVSSPIVDGQSVFFSQLEFRAVPTASGPAGPVVIGKEMKPLYNQVVDLNLSVRANRVDDLSTNSEDSNLYRGTVGFTWGGPRGVPGESEIQSLYFAPLAAKKFTPGTIESSETFEASYSVIIGSEGGNTDLLKSFGDVYRACRTFLKSDLFLKTMKKIDELGKKSRTLPFPSWEMYECHLELARLWYENARRALHFLMTMEPAFTTFLGGYSPDRMGGAFAGGNSHRFFTVMQDFRLIYETFVSSMLQARANYQFLATPEMAKFKGVRTQYHLILRLIDMYRVLAIVPTHPNGLAEYRYFLDQLGRLAEGGNPYLKRFVWQETRNACNVGQMICQLPNLILLDDLFSRRLRPVLGFIRDSTMPRRPPTQAGGANRDNRDNRGNRANNRPNRAERRNRAN